MSILRRFLRNIPGLSRLRKALNPDPKSDLCDYYFSPWIGCTKISEACKHCYAEFEDKQKRWTASGWGKGKPRVLNTEAAWEEPLKWDRKAQRKGVRFRASCAWVGDVFDPEVDPAWRQRLWELIDRTRSLDWMVMTKRPQYIRDFLPWKNAADAWPNVWLGVTAENQKRANERVPVLASAPAVIRYVAIQPILGPVRLGDCLPVKEEGFDASRWWVTVGGECGPDARSFDPAWARAILKECRENGIPFFMNLMSEENNPHFRNFDSFPAELKVREFPTPPSEGPGRRD